MIVCTVYYQEKYNFFISFFFKNVVSVTVILSPIKLSTIWYKPYAVPNFSETAFPSCFDIHNFNWFGNPLHHLNPLLEPLI